jgi:hypothetical protein
MKVRKRRATKMKILTYQLFPLNTANKKAYVSIQLMTTRPLTMLHRSKASPAFPQLMGRVKAVNEAEPIKKRIKAIATGTRWARIPNATWCPMKKNPGRRMTGCQPSFPPHTSMWWNVRVKAVVHTAATRRILILSRYLPCQSLLLGRQ